MSVADQLRNLGRLHESRNEEYGDAYKKHGAVMLALFPEGVNLRTEADQARFNAFSNIVGKINRYAGAFARGGHVDSLDDISVYAQMLQELDREARSGFAAKPDEEIYHQEVGKAPVAVRVPVYDAQAPKCKPCGGTGYRNMERCQICGGSGRDISPFPPPRTDAVASEAPHPQKK